MIKIFAGHAALILGLISVAAHAQEMKPEQIILETGDHSERLFVTLLGDFEAESERGIATSSNATPVHVFFDIEHFGSVFYTHEAEWVARTENSGHYPKSLKSTKLLAINNHVTAMHLRADLKN